MATLGGMFAEDAVRHVAGDGALSGKKEERDAILSYFGELATRSGGDLKVTGEEIIGGETNTGTPRKATHSGPSRSYCETHEG